MATLNLKKFDGKETYRIDRNIKLGRHPNNDLIVKAEGVSRFHCEIAIDSRGRVTVKDLGSANGTYINGKKIAEVLVRVNDVLQIGTAKYLFVAGSSHIPLQDPEETATQLFKIIGIVITPVNHDARHHFWPVNTVSTIGRVASNTIAINSGSISRRHAQIEVYENRVILSDLGSANGTFVQEQRIQQQELKDGDVFGVADFRFVVKFEMKQQSR